MPEYRCRKPFWFQGRLRAVGDIVDYAGLPSDNLEPLCDEGRNRRVEAEAAFEKQRQQARLAKSESGQDLMAAMFMAFEAVQAKKASGRKPAAE